MIMLFCCYKTKKEPTPFISPAKIGFRKSPNWTHNHRQLQTEEELENFVHAMRKDHRGVCKPKNLHRWPPSSPQVAGDISAVFLMIVTLPQTAVMLNSENYIPAIIWKWGRYCRQIKKTNRYVRKKLYEISTYLLGLPNYISVKNKWMLLVIFQKFEFIMLYWR